MDKRRSLDQPFAIKPLITNPQTQRPTTPKLKPPNPKFSQPGPTINQPVLPAKPTWWIQRLITHPENVTKN